MPKGKNEHCLYCGTAKKDCFPESPCCPYCDH